MSAQNRTRRRIAHGAARLPAWGFCVALISCGPPSWPGGIHAVFGFSSRGLRVVDVPADSPALQAGLKQGDAIVAIDAKPIAGLSSAQIHELLSGEVGSFVALTVLRDGVEQKLSIPRAPYAAPARK